MSRSRTAFALGLVVLLLVVGGCSADEPAPRIAPHASPSPTARPSPTPALDPVQTVRAWVEARNVALSTGDTSAVRSMTGASCMPCEELIAPIERVYAAGGHFSTKGWTVDRLRVRGKKEGRIAVVAAVTTAAGETVNEAGGEPVSYEVDHRLMLFKVRKSSNNWAVEFIGYYS